ncbi:hypothetical protein [Methylobacterium sp. B4]|uniref:hypothetical protein n=1 Tax=Methylobacterium sp. B4 TaxID=1938755 RepID=UPI000D76827F|nr:hypothetical protein [Methylobacterium sp. B4]PXW66050.1 hypothetical protein BY998_102378 [Methylobacterium sp. B4]
MISLSDTLMTAASLLGLGAATPSLRNAVQAAPFRDLTDEDDPPLDRGRFVSPEPEAADDPFFLAVADALREAGYLDS